MRYSCKNVKCLVKILVSINAKILAELFLLASKNGRRPCKTPLLEPGQLLREGKAYDLFLKHWERDIGTNFTDKITAIFSKANFMKAERYQNVAERLSYPLEIPLRQFQLQLPFVNKFKKHGHSFIYRTYRSFTSQCSERYEKHRIPNFSEAWNWNKEQGPVKLKTSDFPWQL